MPEQEFLLKEAISKLLYLEKSRLEFFNIHTSSDQIVYFSFFFFFGGGGGGGGTKSLHHKHRLRPRKRYFG